MYNLLTHPPWKFSATKSHFINNSQSGSEILTIPSMFKSITAILLPAALLTTLLVAGDAISAKGLSVLGTSREGMTADKCETSDECQDGRFCFELPALENISISEYGDPVISVDAPVCGETSDDCRCIPTEVVYCKDSSACEDGERCIGRSADDTTYGICISCDASNFVTELLPVETVDDSEGKCDGEGGICVAARFLEHLPSHRLVFENHRRAAVLCDAYGSCATPGHVVVFEGVPVMMKTYCQKHVQVPCVKRSMLVNSPKMEVGLRVPSDSPGLAFTSMAAKYETALEERALRWLLKAVFWFTCRNYSECFDSLIEIAIPFFDTSYEHKELVWILHICMCLLHCVLSDRVTHVDSIIPFTDSTHLKRII